MQPKTRKQKGIDIHVRGHTRAHTHHTHTRARAHTHTTHTLTPDDIQKHIRREGAEIIHMCAERERERGEREERERERERRERERERERERDMPT